MLLRDDIRQFPLFAPLTRAALEALKAHTMVMVVPAGEFLGVVGGSAHAAYILIDGEVVEEWPDGIVTHANPGQLLVPNAVLSDRPCDHNWRVDENAALLRIAKADFDNLLEAEHPFAQALLLEIAQLMALQLRDLNRVFNELCRISATGPHLIVSLPDESE